MISRSCSFCHTMVPETLTYCPSCGHQAHVSRLDYRGPKCAQGPMPVGASVPALLEALAALRRGARPDTDDTPADGTPNPEGSEAMSRKPKKVAELVTREVERTPVSADLASKIRAVDAGLEAEFHLDFAFVILARGNLVASNARDGVVPPMTATSVPNNGG